MDGLQIIELMGFHLPRSRIRISTEFNDSVDSIERWIGAAAASVTVIPSRAASNVHTLVPSLLPHTNITDILERKHHTSHKMMTSE